MIHGIYFLFSVQGGSMKIRIILRNDRYRAFKEGAEEIAATGATMAEAVGNLMFAYQQELGLEFSCPDSNPEQN